MGWSFVFGPDFVLTCSMCFVSFSLERDTGVALLNYFFLIYMYISRLLFYEYVVLTISSKMLFVTL